MKLEELVNIALLAAIDHLCLSPSDDVYLGDNNIVFKSWFLFFTCNNLPQFADVC